MAHNDDRPSATAKARWWLLALGIGVALWWALIAGGIEIAGRLG